MQVANDNDAINLMTAQQATLSPVLLTDNHVERGGTLDSGIQGARLEQSHANKTDEQACVRVQQVCSTTLVTHKLPDISIEDPRDVHVHSAKPEVCSTSNSSMLLLVLLATACAVLLLFHRCQNAWQVLAIVQRCACCVQVQQEGASNMVMRPMPTVPRLLHEMKWLCLRQLRTWLRHPVMLAGEGIQCVAASFYQTVQ